MGAKIEFVALTKNKKTQFDNDLTRAVRDFVGFDEKESGFPRLRFTRREARVIASLLLSEESNVFFDFVVNRRQAVDTNLSQSCFVHFATHSFINNQNPDLSGIVLSLVDEKGRLY
jgi:CHAT domain-containing protein